MASVFSASNGDEGCVLKSLPTIRPPADWLCEAGSTAEGVADSVADGCPLFPSTVIVVAASDASTRPNTAQSSVERLTDFRFTAGRSDQDKVLGDSGASDRRRDSKDSVIEAESAFAKVYLQASKDLDDLAIGVLQDKRTSEEFFLADNSYLQAKTVGLGLRKSMSPADMDKERSLVPWGSLVSGVSIDDQWVKVGDHFLPKNLDGIPVLSAVPNTSEDASVPLGQTPCSEATTVAEGCLANRFCTPDRPDRFPQSSSGTLEKECEELKAELHLARARLARLEFSSGVAGSQQPTSGSRLSEGVETGHEDCVSLDIKDQTIERLQRKLLKERQQADASQQELLQNFEREKEALKHENFLERARRETLQRLYETRVAMLQPPASDLLQQASGSRQHLASPPEPQSRYNIQGFSSALQKASVVRTGPPRQDLRTSRSAGAQEMSHRMPSRSSSRGPLIRPITPELSEALPPRATSREPFSLGPSCRSSSLSLVPMIRSASQESVCREPMPALRLRSSSPGVAVVSSSPHTLFRVSRAGGNLPAPVKFMAAHSSPLFQPGLSRPTTLTYKPVTASSATSGSCHPVRASSTERVNGYTTSRSLDLPITVSCQSLA
jgi:hypothetical protein